MHAINFMYEKLVAHSDSLCNVSVHIQKCHIRHNFPLDDPPMILQTELQFQILKYL